MEYEKIKQLMEDMGNSKLTAIDIDFPDGMKISMKKEITIPNKEVIVESKVLSSNQISEKVNNLSSVENYGKVEVSKDVIVEDCNVSIVKSPMVGTFYAKPSPTSEPFVKVGANVSKGDTVCIIEAMKLMNEIESEFSGKIVEVLVEDGSMVEYGTPLFKIA